MLAEQAQKDVAAQINAVISKVQAANPRTVPATPANPGATVSSPTPL